MEVHKHPHEVMHKKNWSEYLLEFFMIFLAVFLGFLAENQRDGIVERRREKEFMLSMIKDVELDTLQLAGVEAFRKSRLRSIDTVFSWFATHDHLHTVPLSFYLVLQGIRGSHGFYQNSGTLDQLKNSGGLRLVRIRNVVDSIEAYDQLMKKMAIRDHYEIDMALHNVQLTERMFDGNIVNKIRVDTLIYHKPPELESIPFDVSLSGEYLNGLYSYRSVVSGSLNQQNIILLKARSLIKVIREKYHL